MSPYQFEIIVWLVGLFFSLMGLILLGGLWYFRESHKLLVSLDKGLEKIFILHGFTNELSKSNETRILELEKRCNQLLGSKL